MFSKRKSKVDFKTKPLIFVVGSSRSGTTMMSRILGNNSKVFSFNEIHFFGEMWSLEDRNRVVSFNEAVVTFAKLLCIQERGYFYRSQWKDFVEESENMLKNEETGDWTLLDVYSRFLIYYTEKKGKLIPCEQTPRNLFYLDVILDCFPNAKIINMIRDPRDVLLSQKRKWKRVYLGKNFPLRESIRSWINYHPFVIAKLWNSCVSFINKFSDSDRVKNVFFESLLNNPEEEIRKVCGFLDIEYSYSMLKVPVVGSSNTKDMPNVFGIDKTKLNSWEKGGLFPEEIFFLQKISGVFMRQYGYNLKENINLNPFRMVYYTVIFPFKLLLATLLNLKRMKNIAENIKRRL